MNKNNVFELTDDAVAAVTGGGAMETFEKFDLLDALDNFRQTMKPEESNALDGIFLIARELDPNDIDSFHDGLKKLLPMCALLPDPRKRTALEKILRDALAR